MAWVGVDLGTASLAVCPPRSRWVVCEPSLVAVHAGDGEPLAFGRAARELHETGQPDVRLVRPLRGGALDRYGLAAALLRDALAKALPGRPLFRYDLAVSWPAGRDGLQRRALAHLAAAAGARRVRLVPKVLAAALGAGLDVSRPLGQVLVHAGAGSTEIAVLSLNGIVRHEVLEFGGEALDELLVRFVRARFGVRLGRCVAEAARLAAGTAHPQGRSATCTVRGRDEASGLPRSVTLGAQDIQEACRPALRDLVAAVRGVLGTTPPELAGDVLECGLVLTGGLAQMDSLDRLLREELQLPVTVAGQPALCVAMGAASAPRLQGLPVPA